MGLKNECIDHFMICKSNQIKIQKHFNTHTEWRVSTYIHYLYYTS